MRLSELKPCAACGGKITPIWYVLRISQAMINPRSGNQVLGMMQMMGGSLALAEAMVPDADCVLVMGDEEPELMTEINLCQECCIRGDFPEGKANALLIVRSVNNHERLVNALNGDAALGLQIDGLAAVCWHLENGHDNAKISREALAKALRAIHVKLVAARAALALAEKDGE